MKIKCKICEKDLKKGQRYYCSQECYRISRIGKKISEETRQKLIGKKRSQETLEKQRIKKQRDSVRKEGDFSCEKCGKSFSSNTSLRSHKAYCNANDWVDENVTCSCDICKKTFSCERGLKIHVKLVHNSTNEEKEERSEKMKDSKLSQKYRKESIAEVEFFGRVLLLYPDAIRSFRIEKYRHVYDIFIPSINTIIEFDGDFWHGNEAKFSLSERMKKQKELDSLHNDKALSHGYKIVRVWQSESESFLRNFREKNDSY